MTLKRIVSLLLALVMCLGMCFALASCGEEAETGNKNQTAPRDPNDVKMENAFAFVIRDLEINMEGNNAKLKVLELYVAEKDGKYMGGGTGKITVNSAGENVSLDASLVYDDGKLFASVSAAMNGEKQSMHFALDGEEFISFAIDSTGVNLEEIMAEVNNQLTSNKEDLEAWVSEELLPSLGDISSLLPTDEEIEAAYAYVMAIADKFISKKEAGANVEITLDLTTLKSWVASLKTAKVAELIDDILGDNTYATIKEAVPGLLSFTIGEVIAEFEKNGGSVQDLIDAINALFVIFDAPEGFDLDAAFKEAMPEFEGTLVDYIKSPEISSMCLNTFLIMAFSTEDHVMTAEELQEMISGVFAELESKTFVEMTGMSEDDFASVSAAVDMVSQMINCKVVANKTTGELVSIEYNVSVPGEVAASANLKVTKTATGAKASFDVKMAGETIAKGTAEAVVGGDGYYNKLTLANGKKYLGYIDGFSIDSIDAALMAGLYDAQDSTAIYGEDGEKIGIVISTEYNGTYTVYYADVMAAMVAESEGMGMYNVVYVADREYTHTEGGYYDELGNYIEGVEVTETYATTVSAQFVVDMKTGLLVQMY